MSKFVTAAFFLKTPVDITAIDMQTLDRVHMSNVKSLDKGGILL